MVKFTYIELFSGPGGLATGFKRSGLVPLISVEASETTVQTYSKNHDVQVLTCNYLEEYAGSLEKVLDMSVESVLIHGDVKDVKLSSLKEILLKKYFLETVDMVVGCPPCESFSLAGKRLEEDERNDLFREVLRVAHGLDTKLIFFENVKGLLNKSRNGKKGGQFEYLTEVFEARDERTGVKFNLASKDKNEILLTATDYGVPQRRERIFLVGINDRFKNVTYNYPIKTHYEQNNGFVTVGEAFYDLPVVYSGEGEDEQEYCYNYGKDSNLTQKHMAFLDRVVGMNTTGRITAHKATKHKDYMVVRFSHIRQGEGMKAACDRLRALGRDDIINEFFPKKLFAARGRRLSAELPAFTVTSHCFDEMLHPFYDRALTVREAARLQTFPDNYLFEGPYTAFHSSPIQDKYEQIGDAVPVLLAEKLGNELRNTLSKCK